MNLRVSSRSWPPGGTRCPPCGVARASGSADRGTDEAACPPFVNAAGRHRPVAGFLVDEGLAAHRSLPAWIEQVLVGPPAVEREVLLERGQHIGERDRMRHDVAALLLQPDGGTLKVDIADTQQPQLVLPEPDLPEEQDRGTVTVQRLAANDLHDLAGLVGSPLASCALWPPDEGHGVACDSATLIGPLEERGEDRDVLAARPGASEPQCTSTNSSIRSVPTGGTKSDSSRSAKCRASR